MAPTRPYSLQLRLTAKTRSARRLLKLLRPLVLIGALSADRAVSLAMRFVRVDALPEGWAD